MRFFEEGSAQNFWSRSALGLQTSQRILRQVEECKKRSRPIHKSKISSPQLSTSGPDVSSGPTLSALATFTATDATAAFETVGRAIPNQSATLGTDRSTTPRTWVSSEPGSWPTPRSRGQIQNRCLREASQRSQARSSFLVQLRRRVWPKAQLVLPLRPHLINQSTRPLQFSVVGCAGTSIAPHNCSLSVRPIRRRRNWPGNCRTAKPISCRPAQSSAAQQVPRCRH